MRRSERKKPEWYNYKVGVPSTKPNWTNPDCCPLETVYHICHVGEAFRVFEDKRIRSSLVWDESKLKNTRTCVSWVSPNLWVNGSIYGNIRFDFSWKDLVEGKRFYWVEAITHYNPPAFRILISEGDHTKKGLQPYDPKEGDGPLFYDSDETWYWNGEFSGEFLIDEDLWLRECVKVGFVKHHPNMCRRLKSQCEELGKRDYEAGAELIARLVSQSALNSETLFLESSKRRRVHDETVQALKYLRKSLKVVKDSNGDISHDHPAALYLVTAILDRFGRTKGTAKLSDLFSNTEELRTALEKRLLRAFGLKSPQALWDESEESS